MAWLTPQRAGPIGVDVGTRSVKLAQCSADGGRLIDLARWDLPAAEGARPSGASPEVLADALQNALEGRGFRGRDAVVCLTDRELFLQSMRVPKAEGSDLDRLVQQEAVGRLPFPAAEAEIRYLEAADVKQGSATLREVILLACRKADLDRSLAAVERAGLWPVAVDIEPLALVRSGLCQFRRDADQDARILHVHVGHSSTLVVIVQGEDTLFVKYLEIGGRHLDLAVSRSLEMDIAQAAALRRHNGDRRADHQDADVAAAVSEAVRPIVEQLAAELAMCIRYHSVTFRSQPLARLVLGGGEANATLLDALTKRLELKCELSEPLRSFGAAARLPRPAQWDIAVGLALRGTHLAAPKPPRTGPSPLASSPAPSENARP